MYVLFAHNVEKSPKNVLFEFFRQKIADSYVELWQLWRKNSNYFTSFSILIEFPPKNEMLKLAEKFKYDTSEDLNFPAII